MLWLYILTEHERGTVHTGHENKRAGEMPVPPRTDVRRTAGWIRFMFWPPRNFSFTETQSLAGLFCLFWKKALVKELGFRFKAVKDGKTKPK